MKRVRRTPGRLVVVSLGLAMAIAATQSQTLAPPTYTTDQAMRGEAVYMSKCMTCHGDDLSSGEFGPPLKGTAFAEQWGGKSLDLLFTSMSGTMPPDSPGGLGAATYADVLAFIISKNGVAPSAREMPAEVEKLKGMAAPK